MFVIQPGVVQSTATPLDVLAVNGPIVVPAVTVSDLSITIEYAGLAVGHPAPLQRGVGLVILPTPSRSISTASSSLVLSVGFGGACFSSLIGATLAVDSCFMAVGVWLPLPVSCAKSGTAACMYSGLAPIIAISAKALAAVITGRLPSCATVARASLWVWWLNAAIICFSLFTVGTFLVSRYSADYKLFYTVLK